MNTNTNNQLPLVPLNPFTYNWESDDDGNVFYVIDSETWHAIRNAAINAAISLDLMIEGSVTVQYSGEAMAAESEDLRRIFYAEDKD